MKRSRFIVAPVAVLTLLLGYASAPEGSLVKTPVVSGLSEPVFLTAPSGDSTRLFIIEKAGRIRVVQNDTLLGTPFLDIAAKVRVAGTEMGLLGLAFHPDYNNNGEFYVNYTAQPDGRTRVSRFKVSLSDPLMADTGETIVLEIPQFQSNHNGGMMAFGPLDDFLYIGTGDGGSGNDPGNRAQNPDSLLGKILRIDVNVDSTYAIPANNPFVISDTARHEIWAFGVRNPWRWSFDRLTGDMYVADVGQNVREEVSFQPGSSPGGENYGWRLKEGFSCNIPSSGCDPSGVLTDPVVQYLHGGPGRCSITGGYVYRGCIAPEIYGHYIYGDYCTGEIWSFRYDGSNVLDSMDRTAEIGLGGFDLSSFGEDGFGELYVMGISSGTVWRIESDQPEDSCTQAICPVSQTGDVNTTGSITSADIIYLVNYVFKAGPAPLPVAESGDVNCTGNITSADVIYLVNHVFKTGPPPCDVCTIL
jgi:hypothetical protein